ncbi:hypothetical protein HPB52_013099 [Rhipicephalus sanguineus]|uniref:Nuclease HARBI1 n=1 Tax=Rhipicephalus sanguineus TaxID=34632 RepID=A0A9D4PZQ9_RHISA|nr:hypothetical protein HPB52_013099 [Rhipicephalus sanguineus]
MEEFYRIANFPGVTGCIDCTHVKIKSPGGDDAEVFRCRKGYFSINVQDPENAAEFSRHLNDPLPQDDQVVQPQSSSSPAPAAAHGSAAQPSDALPPGEPVDTEDGFRARRRIIRDYYSR